jgi:hypothetical protein
MDDGGARRVASICTECGAPVTFEAGAQQVTCSHCDAGLAVEQGMRLVRLGCPRCGGNFYYVDGSMCGHCPYCDAALLALSQGRVLRYVVRPEAERPAEAGADAGLLMLPFWNLGGMLFGWEMGTKVDYLEDTKPAGGEADAQGGVEVGRSIRQDSGPKKVWGGRVLDMAIPDPATLALGVTSLRTRAAVFPLEPLAKEHESLGRIVPATLPPATAREQVLTRAVRLGAPAQGITRVDCRRSELVAESLSLYYYPFWVDRRPDGGYAVWDAVSGQPEPLSSPTTPPDLSPSALFDQLQVIELGCGQCGSPLTEGNHTSVLPCRACGRFWRVTRDGLVPFEARFARPRASGENPVWLPFWRVEVEVSYTGRVAKRVADLHDVLGMLRPPGQVVKAPPGAPLCYYAPAFGAMRAPRVDHAARDLTRYQPLLEPGEPGRGELYNCFYSEEDARALSYVTLIQVIQVTVIPRIRSLRVKTGEATLWYVPFDQSGRELVNLLTNMRYERAAFRGVRH